VYGCPRRTARHRRRVALRPRRVPRGTARQRRVVATGLPVLPPSL